MYLYFSSQGKLLEVIQEPVIAGSENVNKIYIYVERSGDSNVPTDDGIYMLNPGWIRAKINFEGFVPSSSYVEPVNLNGNDGTSLSMTKLTGSNVVEIPFDNNRDLYHFKYGYKYQMWYIALPTTVTNYTGVVSATAFLIGREDRQLALDLFSFNVQASVGVKLDTTMTQSQYSYLYNQSLFYKGLFYKAGEEYFPESTGTFTITDDSLAELEYIINNCIALVNEYDVDEVGTVKERYNILDATITYNDDEEITGLSLEYEKFRRGTSGPGYIANCVNYRIVWLGHGNATITKISLS